MVEEYCFSGYCRAQDQARTVLLEWTGDSWEADCDFPDCPFAAACACCGVVGCIVVGVQQHSLLVCHL